ncbi:unannotated protein [freshwater metagenome]|uniref:Unannotated protein n=1 Tax=freshwater metagenome TaxID=449393 RepID=A0A6J6G3T2_9ZZZZ|nr:hypothetical protein [Actinomycetota bacterium]
MGFIADFKARRAAKRAQAQFELETYQWQSELELLNTALDIFTNAAKGDEPEDHQLVQKKGELVLWTGQAIFHEAGRAPSTYKGGSAGVSIPVVAGVRLRVGQFSGTVIPGQEMQIDKEAGLVKLTNQRLIFAGSLNTTEWSFAKMLSAARNEEGNDFIIGVSNRKKTSGLKFTASDGKAFARLFALALYAYENGIPETIKEIKSEITRRNKEKPKLELPSVNRIEG